MSIFKKDSIVATYPAYNVVTREASNGIIQVTANELLITDNNLGIYKVGTATAYALQYNECPIEAYQDAVNRGHNLYWINACATVITEMKQEKKTCLLVDFDATYCLEGKIFKIVKTANDNLGFVAA